MHSFSIKTPINTHAEPPSILHQSDINQHFSREANNSLYHTSHTSNGRDKDKILLPCIAHGYGHHGASLSPPPKQRDQAEQRAGSEQHQTEGLDDMR